MAEHSAEVPQCHGHAAKAAEFAEQALSLVHQLAALVEAEQDLEPYGDTSLDDAATLLAGIHRHASRPLLEE